MLAVAASVRLSSSSTRSGSIELARSPKHMLLLHREVSHQQHTCALWRAWQKQWVQTRADSEWSWVRQSRLSLTEVSTNVLRLLAPFIMDGFQELAMLCHAAEDKTDERVDMLRYGISEVWPAEPWYYEFCCWTCSPTDWLMMWAEPSGWGWTQRRQSKYIWGVLHIVHLSPQGLPAPWCLFWLKERILVSFT